MKIKFIYPLSVDPDIPANILLSLKTGLRMVDTAQLETKVQPKFKRVFITMGDIPKRVAYSPLTGEITINPRKEKVRHLYEGVVSNVLLALGMAYYDFGLKKSDQLYWKNLTRTVKMDLALLKRSSFTVATSGRHRLFFASEWVKSILHKKPSASLDTFFRPTMGAIATLSPTRFRGLGVSSAEKQTPITISQSLVGSETLPLSEALDVTGMTGITDELRARGLQSRFDYDESGVFVLHATDSTGKEVLKMKRVFFDGKIKNEYFALDPSLQRQGLGLKAFAAQVVSAVKNGVPEIHLTAERNEEAGLFGYDVWWRFGFDGFIDYNRTDDKKGAADWWEQSVVEQVLGLSDMSLQVNFYALFSSLQKKVGEGEFSPSAFEYLRDVTLAGKYRGKDDFENPTREDFYALISFFNRMSPDSSFLKAKGLSYKFQRIQRLLELDGFEDWWSDNGDKWEATLDLRQGESSPSLGLIKNYLANRGV